MCCRNVNNHNNTNNGNLNRTMIKNVAVLTTGGGGLWEMCSEVTH